jgi:hypothetical protein
LPDDAKLYVPWDGLIKQVFEAFAFDKLELKTDEQVAQLKAKFEQAQQQQMMMMMKQFMATQQLEREKQDKELAFKMKELEHEAQQKNEDRKLKIIELATKE